MIAPVYYRAKKVRYAEYYTQCTFIRNSLDLFLHEHNNPNLVRTRTRTRTRSGSGR